MSEPVPSPRYALTLVMEVRPTTYSLETAARLAEVHPEMLRYYCRLGLCGEARAQPGAELIFDDSALYELRRLEDFRRQHRVSRRTLRLISSLWREVDRLQAELRFLRGP